MPDKLEQYWEDSSTVTDRALPTSLLDKILRLRNKVAEDAKELTESNEFYDLEQTHSSHKPRGMVRRLNDILTGHSIHTLTIQA